MSNAQQQRAWCFTYHLDPTGDTIPDLSEAPNIRYGVMQLEEAPLTGSPHYQGYLELTRPTRLAALKKWLPRGHFEVRRGLPSDARAYCMKLDSRLEEPIEFGEWHDAKQGRRSDILSIKRAIDDNTTLADVAQKEEFFGTFLRYHTGLQKYKLLKMTQRNWPVHVTVIFGEPGSGKSMTAMATDEHAYWVQPPRDKNAGIWWDNYYEQNTVIIDEFYGWMPWDQLLRLCDRYPLMVQTKGGQTQMLCRSIVITTNKFPKAWYTSKYCQSNWAAFQRRVSRWILMMKDNTQEFEKFEDFEDAWYQHPRYRETFGDE